MARYVLTTAASVAFANYLAPGRSHKKGDVVELNATEVTALGSSNMRTVDTAHMHDTLGEAFAVANGN